MTSLVSISTLELLKKQMDEMDKKITILLDDLEKKSKLIEELEISSDKINKQLESERKIFNSLEENKHYLIEVKNETKSNYEQINDAASTLLQILKSKTDKI
jgi:chromosome segregation ATPase